MYGIETIKKLNEAKGQPAVYEREAELSSTGVLDQDEIHEVKKILAKVTEEETGAARIDHDEKLANLRSQTRYVLKGVLDRCKALEEYRDGKYVANRGTNTILELPGGKAIGFGWAGHASGAAGYFYDTFKFWGFAGPHKLYCLPKHRRNEFFDEATVFVESIFGQDAQGLEKLLDTVEQVDDLRELLLLKLKAGDVEREVKAGFAEIANRVKSKATEVERWKLPEASSRKNWLSRI